MKQTDLEQNSKPTVTIAIPAYNEAANLNFLLPAVLEQRQKICDILQVVVVSDGSNDATVSIVESWMEKDSRLSVLAHTQRAGKLKRLSEIYTNMNTDIIVILDADVLPANSDFIDTLVKPFADTDVVMVSANNQPLPGTTFFEKVLNVWSANWYNTRKDIHGGDTAHNARGCGVALRRSFVKQVTFPENIVSDSKWLYFSALRQNKRFCFAQDAVIHFRHPDNLTDYLRQKNRSKKERQTLSRYFGKVVTEKHQIPRKKKLTTEIHSFMHHPLEMICAGFLFLYLRYQSKTHGKLTAHNGLWEVAQSTKKPITPAAQIETSQSGKKYVTIFKSCMKKIRSALPYVLLIASLLLMTTLAVKGQKGSGNDVLSFQKEYDTSVSGPFESSNSSARYALVQAIADQHSFFLTESGAKFGSPDIGAYQGKFTSLFTPGVSLIAVPFYLLGEKIGFPQLFTFFITNLFAIINFFLVARAASKLGANRFASWLSGFLFFFGTNAFPYAFTLTQHHFSITLLLLMFLNALEKRTILRNAFFGALVGIAMLMDIPNLLFAMPLGFYILSQHVVVEQIGKRKQFNFKLNVIAIIIGMLPFILFFGYYNRMTTGSYLKTAQTQGRSGAFKTESQRQIDLQEEQRREAQVVDKNRSESSVSSIFNTRRQLAGLYLLLISDERGIMYYSPIVLFGLWGLLIAYRTQKYRTMAVLALGVILITAMAYSMFSDPWGGWSFGPRYMLPAAAFLCVGIGIAFQAYKKQLFFVLIFLIVAIYSVAVNGLGALTTNAIPPKVEADSLLNPIPHSYAYNIELLDKDTSSSLVFHLFAEPTYSARQYLYFVYTVMAVIGILILVPALLEKDEKPS